MSFLDLPCEYLSVDALDILGSNRVNITGELGGLVSGMIRIVGSSDVCDTRSALSASSEAPFPVLTRSRYHHAAAAAAAVVLVWSLAPARGCLVAPSLLGSAQTTEPRPRLVRLL